MVVRRTPAVIGPVTAGAIAMLGTVVAAGTETVVRLMVATIAGTIAVVRSVVSAVTRTVPIVGLVVAAVAGTEAVIGAIAAVGGAVAVAVIAGTAVVAVAGTRGSVVFVGTALLGAMSAAVILASAFLRERLRCADQSAYYHGCQYGVKFFHNQNF